MQQLSSNNHNNNGDTPCKHCNTVQKQAEADCLELEAHAHKHPAGWCSQCTTTQRQMGHKAREQWIPEKVELEKIMRSFSFLVTSGLVVPLVDTQELIRVPEIPVQLAKAWHKW